MLVHSERKQQREEDTRRLAFCYLFRPWNNNQYVATATFVTTVYSISCPRGAAHPSHLIASAKSQASYRLELVTIE